MRQLLKIAAPVSLTYFGIMLMGLVDLVMVGKLGSAPVGGVGVGNSIFFWLVVTGNGVLSGMDFPASHAIGAENPEKSFSIFIQAMWLATIGGCLFTLMSFLGLPLLHSLNMNSEVYPLAKAYFEVIILSFPAIFIFSVVRSYLQAQNIVNPSFWILVFGNVLNYFLLAGLIFGKFGFPKMGFSGAAWSTVISRVVMAIAAVGVVLYLDLRSHRFFKKVRFKIHSGLIREILILGTPTGFQMLMEVGAFSVSTLIVARFSAGALAAHQIVLTTASTAFMFPLGLSLATTSLVGQAMGQRDFALAKTRGNQSLLLGGGFMGMTALVLLLFPETILSLYHANSEVVGIAKSLLIVVAIFQISDAIQVVGAGCLRGIGNTKLSLFANAIGHWGVGFPIGLMLAFHLNQDVFGIWMGLCIGLTTVAILTLIGWRSSISKLGDEA